MIYYLGIIFLHIGEVVNFYVAPLGLQVLLSYLEYLLCSTLTARFFLHFRRKVLQSQSVVNGTGIITSEQGHGRTTGKGGRWTLAGAFGRRASKHSTDLDKDEYGMTNTSSGSGATTRPDDEDPNQSNIIQTARTRNTEERHITFATHDQSTGTTSSDAYQGVEGPDLTRSQMQAVSFAPSVPSRRVEGLAGSLGRWGDQEKQV